MVLAMFVYRGSIGESGMARSCFNLKGVVYVANDGDKSMSKDDALEKAIETGAEDVLESFDDDDRPAFQVKLFRHTFVSSLSS